jgi:Uma2 family endonuclease
MPGMATTKLLTIEDLAELEDTPGRYDLIRGELISMSPAGGQNGEIALRLGRLIGQYVDDHESGKAYGAETGFILARNPDVLLAPDVAFVSSDRLPPVDQQIGFMEVVPNLVVEVVSPSDRQRDVSAKIMEYLAARVSMVWVIEPSRKIVTIHTPDLRAQTFTVAGELDGGDVLPGFNLKVSEIFR